MFLALAALAIFGCASPQRPYSFHVDRADEGLIADVVQALAANGQEAALIDPAARVVHTTWQDTGFMYGEVQGVTATIVRRYTATVRPEASGAIVMLRMDAQRCARGLYAIEGTALTGGCEVLDGLVPDHQGELDRMGRDVQSTMTSGLVVTAR